MKKVIILAAFAAMATASQAFLVYNNIPATGGYFTSSLRPKMIADDFDIAAVGANWPAQINGLNLTYSTAAAGSFDILVDFFRDIDFSGTTSNIFGTQSPVASYRVAINASGAGLFQTGLMSLGAGFTLPAISDYSLYNHGIRIRFVDTGTTTLSTSAANPTAAFQGNYPLTLGNSENVYWRDADNNGILSGSDARSFAATGTATQANYAFQLGASAVPEPGTMAALGLGAVALIRRRRSSK